MATLKQRATQFNKEFDALEQAKIKSATARIDCYAKWNKQENLSNDKEATNAFLKAAGWDITGKRKSAASEFRSVGAVVDYIPAIKTVAEQVKKADNRAMDVICRKVITMTKKDGKVPSKKDVLTAYAESNAQTEANKQALHDNPLVALLTACEKAIEVNAENLESKARRKSIKRYKESDLLRIKELVESINQ